jgi:glycine/D-amino acid oxidase-like deaminating enzyme
MTAYYAAPLAGSVTLIDKSRLGDPATASFALTRSVRNDYLDPVYARLAAEAHVASLATPADPDGGRNSPLSGHVPGRQDVAGAS